MKDWDLHLGWPGVISNIRIAMPGFLMGSGIVPKSKLYEPSVARPGLPASGYYFNVFVVDKELYKEIWEDIGKTEIMRDFPDTHLVFIRDDTFIITEDSYKKVNRFGLEAK